jgi:hypothetical protein
MQVATEMRSPAPTAIGNGAKVRKGQQTECSSPATAAQSKSDFLRKAIRCARLNMRAIDYELEEVSVDLRMGWLHPEDAANWLHESGLMSFVIECAEAARCD